MKLGGITEPGFRPIKRTRPGFLMLRLSNSEAVRACTIKLLNLKVAKHEKVAIYGVNQRISNVCRIAGAAKLRSNPGASDSINTKRRKFIMTIYDELVARGLIARNRRREIKDLVNNGKATFYIGFDPTADSLHVGHFMALCLMKRLQEAGNKPIALIGGGTAMIGDPSGRTDMRQMMTPETIQHNCDCFKKQMSRFIDFSDGKALMVNNADWLMDLNYVEVLREVGAHFSVNRMLTAECYKQRNGKRIKFPGVQLHADAVLRFPETEPAVRLPDGAWRKRPVVQHPGRC